MARSTVTLLALAALGATQPACKNNAPEAAQRSAQLALGNVRQAREGLDRLTRGFVPVLDGLAPSLAQPIARNNVTDVRFELLGMSSRQVPAGSLSFYPTGFIAAVGTDGNAIARNIAEPDDLMRGMPLANLFPSVRSALAGTSGTSVGELPPTGDQASRVYFVAATPVRGADGAVVGALAAGISYGRLAHTLEETIRTQAGTRPVIRVALQRNGRVVPSGHDRDVPEAWLMPATLTATIPADSDARLAAGHGEFSWSFVEAEQWPWGGAMGSLAELEGTRLLVFRNEGVLH